MLMYSDIDIGMMVYRVHCHLSITKVCMTVCIVNSKQIINTFYERKGLAGLYFEELVKSL